MKGLWDEAFEKKVQDEAAEFVEKAVAAAEARPPATVEDLFTCTYAAMTPNLKEQLAGVEASAKEAAR
jgi:TPP-dependent pyruvate/acetoin dehydrogenase alpha subunit